MEVTSTSTTQSVKRFYFFDVVNNISEATPNGTEQKPPSQEKTSSSHSTLGADKQLHNYRNKYVTRLPTRGIIKQVSKVLTPLKQYGKRLADSYVSLIGLKIQY